MSGAAALQRTGRRRYHEPRHGFARSRPGTVECGVRRAQHPARRRPFRRQPKPHADAPSIAGHPAAGPRRPAGALSRQPAGSGHRPAAARRAFRRGQLGKPRPRRLGPGLGGVARRSGNHPVHLFSAGRRPDARPRGGGNHLRLGPHRTGPAGRRQRLADALRDRHPLRRHPPAQRNRALPLLLRGRRRGGPQGRVRHLRTRGQALPGGELGHAGARLQPEMFAPVQRAGHTRRRRGGRAGELFPAHAQRGAGHFDVVRRAAGAVRVSAPQVVCRADGCHRAVGRREHGDCAGRRSESLRAGDRQRGAAAGRFGVVDTAIANGVSGPAGPVAAGIRTSGGARHAAASGGHGVGTGAAANGPGNHRQRPPGRPRLRRRRPADRRWPGFCARQGRRGGRSANRRGAGPAVRCRGGARDGPDRGRGSQRGAAQPPCRHHVRPQHALERQQSGLQPPTALAARPVRPTARAVQLCGN